MRSRTTTLLSRLAGAAVALALLLPLFSPGIALAHERRNVGPYTFIVGWMGEPSLVGQPNGIDLRISKTADGSPVEGAEKTLKAAIAFGGGQAKPFTLRTVFGKPGAYTADVIPTKAGSYIFTFTGTLEGTQVNEKFESGPGRFDDAQATDALQFPVVVPPAGQTADAANAAAQAAKDAQAKVAQAQTFGIAGIVLGLLGLALGGAALAAARRANGAPARQPVAGSATAPRAP